MTREDAYQIADEYIEGVWGASRTAWINGFINYPQRGVAKYERTSQCAIFRKKGVKDRKHYNKENS